MCVLAVPALAESAKTVTWTGWFSDQKCAAPRAQSGTFTATNPDCAKKCLEEGTPAVFIAQDAKVVLKVTGYANVAADLGYRLEVRGTVNEAGDELAVERVTRLEYQGASCGRPKQKK